MSHRAELLDGLTEAEARGVRALGQVQRLDPGQVLFALGSEASHLYLVERGRVALTLPVHVADREQEIPVEERGAGQALGWSALIPPHRFTLTARALVETEVLVLPRSALLAHFDANPAVGLTVTRTVASLVGHRLQVIQAMWLREMQRVITLSYV